MPSRDPNPADFLPLTPAVLHILLALADGVVPATLNHDEPDPACPVSVVRFPRPVTRHYVVKVNVTEQGQCAAIVVRAN